MNAVQELDNALHVAGVDRLPRAILSFSAADADAAHLKSIQRMLARATVRKPFKDSSNYRFKDIEELYLQATYRESPTFVRDALNYLRLYEALAIEIRRLKNDLPDLWFDARMPRGVAESLIGRIAGVCHLDRKLASTKVISGKLHALRGRSQARKLFGDACAEMDGYSTIFNHDLGASTFFDEMTVRRAVVGCGAANRRAPKLQMDQVDSLTGAQHVVLFSMEHQYTRTFLPYWLSIAEYVKQSGIAFHFIIADRGETPVHLANSAREVLRTLGAFRMPDVESHGENVSFSTVQVPPWCQDVAAFSACARFLYARQLSEQLGMSVIVQDVDMNLAVNPSPYFDALPTDRIGITSNRPGYTVDPWRKFLGGMFLLPHEETAFQLMRRLEDYLLCGLVEKRAWGLDQNGLSYLHDVVIEDYGAAEERLFSLSDPALPPRPDRGVPIHGLLLERHRAMECPT